MKKSINSSAKIYNNVISAPEGYTISSAHFIKTEGNTINFNDANFDLDNAAYNAHPQVLKSVENIKCEYSISNSGGNFSLTKDNSAGLVYTDDNGTGTNYWPVRPNPTYSANNLFCTDSVANCSLSTSLAQ